MEVDELTTAAANSGNTSIEFKWAPLARASWFHTSVEIFPFQASRFVRGLVMASAELMYTRCSTVILGVALLSLCCLHQAHDIDCMRYYGQQKCRRNCLERPIVRWRCCRTHGVDSIDGSLIQNPLFLGSLVVLTQWLEELAWAYMYIYM